MTYLLLPLLLIAAIAAAGIFAFADTLPPSAGEELMFSGHASAYQDTQAYWSELGQAHDWDSLKAQVRRWQEIAKPGWAEADIEDVARSLNQAVFRFAEPGRQLATS